MNLKIIPAVFLFILIPMFIYAQDSDKAKINSVTFHESFNNLNTGDILISSGLQKGGIYSEKDRAKYFQKIEKYCYEHGFLYAQVKEIKGRFSADGQNVDLMIDGNPGKQVLLDEIKIESDSIASQFYQNQLSSRENMLYSEAGIEQDIDNMLSLAADSGYIFAKAQIENIEIVNKEDQLYANIFIHIQEGRRVFIDDIQIKGNSYTNPVVILRELPVGIGQQYSQTYMEQIPRRLMRLGIFKNVETPNLSLTENGKHILGINVEEANATTFDGIVGYIPERGTSGNAAKQEGFFTGLVDISFKNIFGTARKFDIHWQKPDRDSENFFLRYTEPWLLNYPFDLSLGLQRTVRDSTYIEWKGNLQMRWRYNADLSLTAGVERQVVLPDSVSNRNLRLVRYEQTNLEIGLQYDTRDYEINPRKGVYFSNSYSLGLKNNFGPGYLLREDSIETSEQVENLKVHFQLYYEIFRNQVFAFHFTGNQVKGDRLQITDYTWFGGSQTLRGYRENQFRGDITSWINLEYRFLLGRNSRIFLFNDWGAYHYKDSQGTKEEILPGYGLGIRIETALGIMAVDFGLGKGDNFSQAKIHFGIINRF